MSKNAKLLLDMENASIDAASGLWDVGVTDATLRLCSGELALVWLEPRHPRHPLPDLARGLVSPTSGSVRIQTMEWTALSADEAAAARGRIGHGFGGVGFLSNLNVDENITLPLRYHARLSSAAARDRAMEWAHFFGWESLPAERPAWVSPETLQVAQWIRAFSGKPDLLVLDRPCEGCSDELAARFADAVAQECCRGAAALWLIPGGRKVSGKTLSAATVSLRCQGPLLQADVSQTGACK